MCILLASQTSRISMSPAHAAVARLASTSGGGPGGRRMQCHATVAASIIAPESQILVSGFSRQPSPFCATNASSYSLSRSVRATPSLHRRLQLVDRVVAFGRPAAQVRDQSAAQRRIQRWHLGFLWSPYKLHEGRSFPRPRSSSTRPPRESLWELSQRRTPHLMLSAYTHRAQMKQTRFSDDAARGSLDVHGDASPAATIICFRARWYIGRRGTAAKGRARSLRFSRLTRLACCSEGAMAAATSTHLLLYRKHRHVLDRTDSRRSHQIVGQMPPTIGNPLTISDTFALLI
ncbi:hypothetical protein FKP32DRAFT_210866 [Trametes sanguinea]|nr:hypothetical protein FKP32DRAFT_210866 [Trametes sanguinea]